MFDSKVCFGNLEKQLPTDANMRVNTIWMFSKDSSIFHDNVLLLMGLMVSLISVHWFYPARGQDVVVNYQQNTIREDHIFGLRVYMYAHVPVLSYLILRLFCFYMAVFNICQFFGRYFGNANKDGRYSVFQSPNGNGKIRFLVEYVMVTVFIQKFDYDITVIFEKIYGNTVS